MALFDMFFRGPATIPEYELCSLLTARWGRGINRDSVTWITLNKTMRIATEISVNVKRFIFGVANVPLVLNKRTDIRRSTTEHIYTSFHPPVAHASFLYPQIELCNSENGTAIKDVRGFVWEIHPLEVLFGDWRYSVSRTCFHNVCTSLPYYLLQKLIPKGFNPIMDTKKKESWWWCQDKSGKFQKNFQFFLFSLKIEVTTLGNIRYRN